MRRASKLIAKGITKYLRRLFSNDYLRCIDLSRGYLLINEFNELFYVSDEQLINVLNDIWVLKPLATGLHVGWFFRDTGFIPSPALLEHLYSCLGVIKGAIEVSDLGIKAFLYGNDILLQSVIKVYRPIKEGMYVAVIDNIDKHVIGVGKARYDHQELNRLMKFKETKRTLEVISNVFDLGKYLHEEEVTLKIK